MPFWSKGKQEKALDPTQYMPRSQRRMAKVDEEARRLIRLSDQGRLNERAVTYIAHRLRALAQEQLDEVVPHSALAEHKLSYFRIMDLQARKAEDILATGGENLEAIFHEEREFQRKTHETTNATEQRLQYQYGLSSLDSPTAVRYEFNTRHKSALESAPADGYLRLDSVQLEVGRRPGIESDLFFVELAKNIRVRQFCRQHVTSVPEEHRNFDRLMEELESLANASSTWPNLNSTLLRILAFEQMLTYGLANDVTQIGRLADLYRILIQRLPADERYLLMNDISLELHDRDAEFNALLPFIQMDPDLAVVSTAAMNYSLIHPESQGDPLAGPRACLAIAQELSGGDEHMSAGILQGLVLLGDMRVVDLLQGCWRRLSDDGKSKLSHAWSGALYAGTVAFWLRWMEDVEEEELGYPAGALSTFGNAVGYNEIRHIKRRFPCPFNLPPEDLADDPPIQTLAAWSKVEFARIIEPRLRVLMLQETYDKVTPRVMEVWGIDVGHDDHEFQLRRLIEYYVQVRERLTTLAPDVTKINLQTRTPVENAAVLIRSVARDMHLDAALKECRTQARTLVRNGATKLVDIDEGRHADDTDPERVKQLMGMGFYIEGLLLQALGPDLDASERLLKRMVHLGVHDYM